MQKKIQNLIAVIILVVLFILLIYFVSDYKKRGAVLNYMEDGSLNSRLGPFDPESPEPTLSLENAPFGSTLIKASNGKFTPSKFNVRTGEVVSIVLQGLDGTHSLVFKDKSLEKIKIYVGRDEIRGISFVAPKPGDYKFFCGVPGHQESGEEGVMLVQ